MKRCRICTANDREALINEIAAGMWDTQRAADGEWVDWNNTGPYWQRLMRQFAEATVEVVQAEHSLPR